MLWLAMEGRTARRSRPYLIQRMIALHIARRGILAAALLAAPLAAPLGAQRARLAPPERCTCAEDDRDRRWLWIVGLLGGGALAAGMPHETRTAAANALEGFTTLDGRPTPAIAVDATPRRPLIPLTPSVPVVRSSRMCTLVAVPVPVRRSHRAVEREKAWWRGLTPAEKARVDRENARRERQEQKQRKLLCVVLFPVAVPAAWGLKVALAAGTM